MAMRTTAKASTVRGFGTTLSIIAPADAVRFLGTVKSRLEEGAFEAELGL